MVLGAGYLLNSYRRCFYGPLQNAQLSGSEDLLPRELATLLIFALLVLLFGLFPSLILDYIRPTITGWLEHLP
jgi:NADH-quinone oxidoreductase subunit M